METSIIPANIEGKQNDLSFSKTLADREQALDCFKRACKRLLNPPVWHELAGMLSGEFTLFGESGQGADRLAQAGDYLRIDLPGPGPRIGDGYDWVKVSSIEDKSDPSGEEERVAMKLHPSANPKSSDERTAHFLQEEASSTFIIERKGNVVTVSYHSRNEVPNTHTGNIIDNLRNNIITSGAFAGLSEAQWSSLIKAFLQAEIGG